MVRGDETLNKKFDEDQGEARIRRNVSLARIIPVIEVPLHFRTRIATPRLNAPWEGVADGASGFHGNAASTAPTLRTRVVPTRVESVATRGGGSGGGGNGGGGSSSDGGAERTKGDGNRPSGTVTVGASPFDAACRCVLFYGVIEKNLPRTRAEEKSREMEIGTAGGENGWEISSPSCTSYMKIANESRQSPLANAVRYNSLVIIWFMKI